MYGVRYAVMPIYVFSYLLFLSRFWIELELLTPNPKYGTFKHEGTPPFWEFPIKVAWEIGTRLKVAPGNLGKSRFSLVYMHDRCIVATVSPVSLCYSYCNDTSY